jgi:hypothetical protein
MAGRVSAGYPAVASVTLPRARAAALPRRYTPETSASDSGYVELNADGLPTLQSASPIPFDGPLIDGRPKHVSPPRSAIA